MSIFQNFFNRFAPANNAAEVEATLPVDNLSVEQVTTDSKTVTFQATVGLTPITLNVPEGTTYLEAIELSKKQVPGLNVAANMVTVLNTDTNETLSGAALSRPVSAGNFSLEATSGTAGI